MTERAWELERAIGALRHAEGSDMGAHLRPGQSEVLLEELADLDRLRKLDPLIVAVMFHDAYERLAPDFDYETREDSAKPWDEVPENNRELMIATVRSVLDRLTKGE